MVATRIQDVVPLEAVQPGPGPGPGSNLDIVKKALDEYSFNEG
jgi:hypothetical protein